VIPKALARPKPSLLGTWRPSQIDQQRADHGGDTRKFAYGFCDETWTTFATVARVSLNPKRITGRLAEISLATWRDDLRAGRDPLPIPIRLRWADLDLALADAELTLVHGTLLLKIFGGGLMEIRRKFGVLNKPSEVTLADGTTLTAVLTHLRTFGSTTRRDGSESGGAVLELDAWEWLPSNTSGLTFWGAFDGLDKPPNSNLVLHAGDSWSSEHLRLKGRLQWHLIKSRRGCIAVVVFPGRPTGAAVRTDLAALDFVAGSSLDVPVLWALDREQRTVGAIGPGCPRPITHRSRSPVPDQLDSEACWEAPLFEALAAHTRMEDPHVSTAITGYLDGLRGHIHGGYLLAQVALEAFCKATVGKGKGKPSPLVKSTTAWQAFVKLQQSEVKKHAHNDVDAQILLNKLQYNVFQRPTGEVVVRAFDEWKVALPTNVRKEIAKRNTSAHDFVMFDEVAGNLQDAADRVDMVQMLLAAALAKRIGYTGPIVGWERDTRGALKVPEFWTWSTSRAAEARFLCAR
jgi:hypothetical protein